MDMQVQSRSVWFSIHFWPKSDISMLGILAQTGITAIGQALHQLDIKLKYQEPQNTVLLSFRLL
jgi:hypothetical protein